MATAARKTTARKRKKGAESGFGLASEDQSSLDQYLKEVSTHALLTSAQEIELGTRARAGDEQAVSELVRANLRFVISVAK
jgi:RNA polymerase primary sigma factor